MKNAFPKLRYSRANYGASTTTFNLVSVDTGGLVADAYSERAAKEIVRSVNNAATLADALRNVLPLAKEYLRAATKHPDNGKIADAVDALAGWNGEEVFRSRVRHD